MLYLPAQAVIKIKHLHESLLVSLQLRDTHTHKAIGEMHNIRQREKTKEEVTTISGSMDGLYQA